MEKESSAIGLAFHAVGILIWVIGGLFCVFAFMGAITDGEGAGIGFLSLLGTGLLGMFFYGFGEVLCLLKGIYAVLKNGEN